VLQGMHGGGVYDKGLLGFRLHRPAISFDFCTFRAKAAS
jgi:hypothetical protein